MDIVIIDDDEISCFLISSILENMELGKNVHCITNSCEGLEYLKQIARKEALIKDQECTLVFLDTNMPVIDGFELLEELDKCSSIDRQKLHVVLLTSILTDRQIKKASRYNHQGYYVKPLTQESILEVIARMPSACP